jgi:hypothetical protein
MASLNAQEKAALQLMTPSQQASFAAASPEQRQALMSSSASLRSDSEITQSKDRFILGNGAAAVMGGIGLVVMGLVVVVTRRRQVAATNLASAPVAMAATSDWSTQRRGGGVSRGNMASIDSSYATTGEGNMNPVHLQSAAATTADPATGGAESIVDGATPLTPQI